SGQCYMLGYRGIAYWFLTWGPEDYREQLEDHRAELRDGFQILDDRAGWKPRPRPSERYRHPDLGFQFNYPTELWEKEKNPKEYDDLAELVLRAYETEEDEETGEKTTKREPALMATIRVLLLPAAAADSPAKMVELAKEHMKKKLADEHPA